MMDLTRADQLYLLDVLAYLVCDEKIAYELGYGIIGFSVQLYRKIVDELKSQLPQDDHLICERYSALNAGCRAKADLFYAEAMLDMLEKRVLILQDYRCMELEHEKWLQEEAYLAFVKEEKGQ
jgi:hypothetical protein